MKFIELTLWAESVKSTQTVRAQTVTIAVDHIAMLEPKTIINRHDGRDIFGSEHTKIYIDGAVNGVIVKESPQEILRLINEGGG